VDPEPEPSLQGEGFFARLARVAEMSLPREVAGRIALGVLLWFALLAIVVMGGRIADLETLTFGRAVVLSGLLGAFLAADVVLRGELLRADRASWVLPAQAVAWSAAAWAVLREDVGRIVLLLAFMLFSLSIVVFSAGAIVVSF
jgi:hypothetical protein